MTDALACTSCRGPVTKEEAVMYDGVCEFCARIEWERVRSWREGRHDPEIDARHEHPRRRVN